MKRAVLLILLGLIASACRIDVDLRVDLHPDGSGDFELNLTTDAEFENLFRLTNQEFEEFVFLRGEAAGLSFQVTEGESTVYHSSVQSLTAESIENLLEGLVPGLGAIDITPQTETLEFSAELQPLTEADLLTPFFSNFDPAELAENVHVTVTLAMPGTLDVSSANITTGNELTFEIPFAEQSTRIFARSKLVEEGGNSIPWGLIILIVVIAGALAFLRAIRSQAGRDLDTSPPLQPSVPYAPEDRTVAPPAIEEPPPPEKLFEGEEPAAEDQVLANPEDRGET